MRIQVSGYVAEVKLGANSKGEVVTDAFLVQGSEVIRCRWKGDKLSQVKSDTKADVVGNLVTWFNERSNTVSKMILCS
jgi:hypothetical protein